MRLVLTLVIASLSAGLITLLAKIFNDSFNNVATLWLIAGFAALLVDCVLLEKKEDA